MALRLLSDLLGPLGGWAAGLVLYWAGMAAALLGWGHTARLRELAQPSPPGGLLWALLLLPAVVVGGLALRLLGSEPIPVHVVLACAIGALANGTLEELTWRGALVPEAEPRPLALALGLFVAFHLAWAGAAGLHVPGGVPGTLGAALALGGLWTAARLLTGTLGAAMLSHVLLNVGLFALLVALNWPPV